MKIVPLKQDHFEAVATIYAQGLETGIASFEISVPPWEEWNEKFHQQCRFVILIDNVVAGWCALSPVSKRSVYSGVAEDTIYIAKAYRHRGLGNILLNHLISASEAAGFWTLQAGIFPQNTASIKLHEDCGFRILGVREKIAQRDGFWYNNVLMERRSKKVNYMKNVLVLCTGNSCRSQMAHGYLKTFAAGKATIYSAGIETHGLNPGAVSIMAEDGIDISNHTSNHVDEYQGIDWDFIITVCDHANEHCPFIPAPNAKRLHYNFSDPSKAKGTETEIHNAFLKTRNEIKEYCRNFIETNL
jgi:arsenate reductase